MVLTKTNHGNNLHYCQQRMYIEGTWNNLITVKKLLLKLTFRDIFEHELCLLGTWAFLAYHEHFNCYPANTQQLTKSTPGHLPVHFRDQHVVFCNYKG